MSNLIKPESNGLVGLLHSQNEGLVMPKPFERDIFLFETYVAGTSHVKDIKELEPTLDIDDRLEFFREPDNAYDPEAIVIKTVGGNKIGYIPRCDNVVFARLMDAGKSLFGTVTSKEMRGEWLKLSIKVFLHE